MKDVEESVAKAIWEECQGISYCGKQAYNVDPTKEEAMQLARAAIKAMNEIKVGNKYFHPGCNYKIAELIEANKQLKLINNIEE